MLCRLIQIYNVYEMGYTGQHEFDSNTIRLNQNTQKTCQVHGLCQVLLGLIFYPSQDYIT